MQQALSEFQSRVVAIEGTIDLRDALMTFGQVPRENLAPESATLHLLISEISELGLQPILNGSVLLLSAALEQFVADVIIAFAEDLPRIVVNYGDLPERIRNANERMTGEAISVGNFRNRFSDYVRHDLVDNLKNCQAGKVPYVLNGEALVLHNRNLNPDTLGELTGRLGIRDIWHKIGSTEALKEWATQENAEPGQAIARTRLEELIETRNQIAHGVGNANPGANIVRNFYRFESALVRSLVEVLTNYSGSLLTQDPGS